MYFLIQSGLTFYIKIVFWRRCLLQITYHLQTSSSAFQFCLLAKNIGGQFRLEPVSIYEYNCRNKQPGTGSITVEEGKHFKYKKYKSKIHLSFSTPNKQLLFHILVICLNVEKISVYNILCFVNKGMRYITVFSYVLYAI